VDAVLGEVIISQVDHIAATYTLPE